MARTTITEGIRRAARLTPFDAGTLQGIAAAVCTPAETLPAELRALQRIRTAEYLSTGSRTEPGYAPRYVVTSYGEVIAWVDLAGVAHYAPIPAPLLPGTRSDAGIMSQHRAMTRHRDAIRSVWPHIFRLDSMGDPIFRNAERGGAWSLPLSRVEKRPTNV